MQENSHDKDPIARSRELFFQGIGHFEANELEAACGAFEAALTLAPGRPSILANLGVTQFRLQRHQAAVATLEAADRADPGQTDVLFTLGQAHEALGAWPQAARALERALQLAPENPPMWLSCGICHLQAGAIPAALQALDQATRKDPAFALAWSHKGNLLRELNRLEEAAHCFEQALACGADPERHHFYLAAVRQQRSAETPLGYVEELFDNYAEEFEDHLVGKLGYQGYELLVRPLVEGGQSYQHALDLGCGTGLCGNLLQGQVAHLTGVDLSSAMLERTRATGLYQELVHADIGSYLNQTEATADLVLAADVFGYLGDLQGIFHAVRRILAPGGCFAFTVELCESGQEIELLPCLRHTHAESYIRRITAAAGFSIRELRSAPLRYDQQDPIPALYVYLE